MFGLIDGLDLASRLHEMTHYPPEIACEIEIDKNFNLDRTIYTLSKFLSIEIEIAILRLAGSIFSHFTYIYCCTII
jgi:hypothetical protein